MDKTAKDYAIVKDWVDAIKERIERGNITSEREQALVALIDYFEEGNHGL